MKNKNVTYISLLTMGAALLPLSAIAAETLALFEFTGGSAVSTATVSPYYTVSEFAPSAAQAANAWLPSPTYASFGFRTPSTSYNEATKKWENKSITPSAALSSDFYASFTFTPAETANVTLDALSFCVGLGDADGKNSTITVTVYAQIGSSEQVLVGSGNFINTTGSGTASNGKFGDSITLDLTSVSGINFSELTDAVTFRFYFSGGRDYNSGTYWTARIDDINLTGTAASSIPEPAATAMFTVLGTLGILLVAKIRHR